MKERIIGVVMIIVILIGFASYSGTFAWINTTVDENAENADLTVGRMFSIVGELGSRYSMGDKKIMVPGENLIVRPLEEGEIPDVPDGEVNNGISIDDYTPCELSLKNDATIETQLRLKIEYSFLEYENDAPRTYGSSGNWCVYGELLDTHAVRDLNGRLQVEFTAPNRWVFDHSDGFWYYNPTEASSGTDNYLIVPANTANANYTDNVDLINYIRYDPDYYTDSTRFDYSTVWQGQEVQVRLVVQAKQARYADWNNIGWGTVTQQSTVLGA